jgi:FtsH-binding integral membrane protein
MAAAVASEEPRHFAERYGIPVATTIVAAAVPNIAGNLLLAAIGSLGITLPYFSQMAFRLTQPVSCVAVFFAGLVVLVVINSRPTYAHRAGVAHSVYLSVLTLYVSAVLLGLVVPLRLIG